MDTIYKNVSGVVLVEKMWKAWGPTLWVSCAHEAPQLTGAQFENLWGMSRELWCQTDLDSVCSLGLMFNLS